MAKSAKSKDGTEKIDGRSKAARAAKAAAGTGGNGRDLHLGDNADNADAVRTSFLQLRRQWTAAIDDVKDAKDALKEIIGALKSEGFTERQMKIAAAMDASPQKAAKIAGEIKDRLQVARWIGHSMGKKIDLKQFDLFDDKPTGDPVQAAYEDGERAGLEGQTGNPPSQYSAADLSQAWLAGHHKGQDANMKGIKPLGGENMKINHG